MSIARATLGRARREELQHFIDASIVFGRSVTFHLQKECGNHPEFDSWYEKQQEGLRKDAVARFLLDRRNYILKEGPVRLGREMTVSIAECLVLSDSIETQVVRAKPWYRRPPTILWQDTREWVMRPIRRWRRERASMRLARSGKGQTETRVEDVLHFDHEEWRDRSAFDVLEMYLKQLDRIVSNAEARFFNSAENGERT